MKELEIEYKKQIELELPDLWSRIESGVDAYEASKNNDIKNETTKVVEFANIDSKKEILEETKQEEKTNKIVELDGGSTTKKSNKRIISTVMKIVAAAASLFLVVNVISLFGGVKTNDSTAADVQSFAPMADAAATADEAACETSAPAAAEEAEWESAEVDEEAEHIYDAEEGLATEVAAGTQSEIADSAVNKESIRGETDASEIKGGATAGESAETELSLEEMTQKLVEAIGCSDEEASDMVLILQSIGVVEIEDIISYKENDYALAIVDNKNMNQIFTMHTEIDDDKLVVSYICIEDNTDDCLYIRE